MVDRYPLLHYRNTFNRSVVGEKTNEGKGISMHKSCIFPVCLVLYLLESETVQENNVCFEVLKNQQSFKKSLLITKYAKSLQAQHTLTLKRISYSTRRPHKVTLRSIPQETEDTICRERLIKTEKLQIAWTVFMSTKSFTQQSKNFTQTT